MPTKSIKSIVYLIISSMLFYISDVVLLCLEYPRKYSEPHKNVDNIFYLLYSIDFVDFESINKFFFSLCNWMLKKYLVG